MFNVYIFSLNIIYILAETKIIIMKLLKNLFKTMIIGLLLVTSVACSDDDDGNLQPVTVTVTDFVLANLSDYSLLLEALQKADGDLVTTLSGPGPFTVFAPNNAAFTAFLNANGFANLDAVPSDVLAQILLNHVVSGAVQSSQLSTGFIKTSATSTAANQLMSMFVDTSSGVTLNGVSNVTGADNIVDNGVVHLVDAVIGLPSIATLAAANSDFSSLVAALDAASLVPTVDMGGPFTVLAPNDAAFTAFLDGASLGDIPVDALTQVLLNHVLDGSILSTDLTSAGAGYNNTLATGAGDNPMSIYFDTSSGVSFNGVSNVAAADVIAENGVIHAVDAVIDLPTVVTFALADPTFSTLVAALTDSRLTTDFVSILSTADGTDPAPFTVFAPTNDAFAALLTELNATGLGDIDEPTLNATLTYHVVGGANVVASDLMDDLTVTTLGGDITANVTGGATLTDANDRVSNIVATDLQAANGVIHAIDKVILPPL